MTTLAHAALFAENAYHAHKTQDGEGAYLDSNALPLPTGWELLKVEDRTERQGDYAALFINRETKELFIAGRGTAQWSDVKTYPGILVGKPPQDRITSALDILNEARRDYPDYRIDAGGHSLGGLIWAKASAQDESYKDYRQANPVAVTAFCAPNTP